ncbi:MAG: hypothetical protein AAB276_08245 [Pseudomonadota bacterium]
MSDNVTTPLTIQEKSRQQIAIFLPAAIEKAINSYRLYVEKEELDGEFSDRHKAAKIALAHIELLIKLAKWADLPDADIEDKKEADYFIDVLCAAKMELAQHEISLEDNGENE